MKTLRIVILVALGAVAYGWLQSLIDEVGHERERKHTHPPFIVSPGWKN